MKKITEQELEDLQKINADFSKLKSNLADAEIEIKKINLFKEDVFLKIEEASKVFKEQETKLLDTYGKVSINIQTGEITDDENK